ncbi:MAG: M48 family metallopeptidase [Verrucomicrobiales bacterium]
MNIEPRVPVSTADISRAKVSRKTWRKEVAGFIAGLILVYLLFGWIADFIAARCPDSWEAKLAGDGTTWIGEGSGEGSEVKGEKIARDAFRKILESAGPKRELEYRLVVTARGNGPNAFAAPGGWVVLTPELLEMVESEPGIAFVLAHELGHHEHRHILKRISRTLVFSAAISLVSQQAGSGLISSTAKFDQLAFSRSHEREADEYALAATRKIYGRDGRVLEFFEKMLKESPQYLPAMFSTHPSTQDRLQSLRELLEAP